MLSFIRRLTLYRTVDSYLLKLGPAMAQRYGTQSEYTVMQIDKMALHLGLNMKYLPYAIAMFRSSESKNTLNYYKIDQLKLDSLRHEVADTLHNGSTSFSAIDTIKLASPKRWKGGAHSNWQANRNGQTGC